MTEPLSPSGLALISAVEIALWLAGAFVLLRFLFGDATRARREAPAPLQAWSVAATHFFSMALCVVVGGWIVPVLVFQLGTLLTHKGDLWLLLQSSALQFGLLAGVIVALCLPRDPFIKPEPLNPAATPPCPHPFLDAAGTFLIALPLITLIGFAWKTALDHLGIDTREQEMVDVFRHADSPVTLAALIILAVIIAPLTEELIFRAGLFRYLRTRLPRWVALVVPAAVFAALHANTVAFLPLLALGVFFSLAYERTGRISVTIIAHALFNLHTILLILAGVTT